MHRRTEAAAAIELAGIAGFRADAADRAVSLRITHVFQRIHRLHAEIALRATRKVELFAQLLADQREHGVVFGLRQIAHGDPGRIDASASRTRDDQRNLSAPTERDGFDLDAKRIAAVQHQVVPATDLLHQRRRCHEGRFGVDLQRRRNLLQSLAQGLDLALAELAFERMQLPVRVRYADFVGIEQGQFADTAARQRFRHPGADAANADDGHVRRLQTSRRTASVKAVDTGKSSRLVHGRVRRFRGAKDSGCRPSRDVLALPQRRR